MIEPIYDQPACILCAHCHQPLELTWTNSCEGHRIYHSDCYKQQEKTPMAFNPNPDLNQIITTVKRIRDRAYKLDNTAGIIQALNGYLDLLDGLATYTNTDLDQLVWDQEKFWQADEAETANQAYTWETHQ